MRYPIFKCAYCLNKKDSRSVCSWSLWRSGWDSNPLYYLLKVLVLLGRYFVVCKFVCNPEKKLSIAVSPDVAAELNT